MVNAKFLIHRLRDWAGAHEAKAFDLVVVFEENRIKVLSIHALFFGFYPIFPLDIDVSIGEYEECLDRLDLEMKRHDEEDDAA